jgi:hypothetical protein
LFIKSFQIYSDGGSHLCTAFQAPHNSISPKQKFHFRSEITKEWEKAASKMNCSRVFLFGAETQKEMQMAAQARLTNASRTNNNFSLSLLTIFHCDNEEKSS